MKPKCQEQPNPTSQQNATQLHLGWCAARAGEPLDETQSDGWQVGWMTWHQPHIQQKMYRLGLLN